MHQVARPASIWAEIPPVYAPPTSACASWAPTATPVPASASRTTARDTNGGHRTRMTPGTSVAAAMAAARGPASVGRPFIFQLPAMMMGRMSPLSGRVANPCPRAGLHRRGVHRPGVPGQPLDTPQGTLDTRSGHAKLLRRARRASPPGRRCAPGPPAGPATDSSDERVAFGQRRDGDRLAMRRPDRPRQVGALGVEHPVEVAVELTRHEPRLQLQDAGRCAHPAQQREHAVDALPGHHAPTPAETPRRLAPRCPRRAPRARPPRPASTTSSRCT